jgi:HSP20 family protein
MTLIKRNLSNPFFTDWMEDFFTGDTNPLAKLRVTTVPAVNVYENDTSYRIELAVPGLKKKDIMINLNNDILKISAEIEAEVETENEKCTKREYSYKSFSRSFTLPESVDKEKIDAEAIDGILKITIMKKEEEIVKPPREIKIK